jgi:hypothetical protein
MNAEPISSAHGSRHYPAGSCNGGAGFGADMWRRSFLKYTDPDLAPQTEIIDAGVHLPFISSHRAENMRFFYVPYF